MKVVIGGGDWGRDEVKDEVVLGELGWGGVRAGSELPLVVG